MPLLWLFKRPIHECEECKSKNIKYLGSGTQKLDAEIKKFFQKQQQLEWM